jgi:hypothetical protein
MNMFSLWNHEVKGKSANKKTFLFSMFKLAYIYLWLQVMQWNNLKPLKVGLKIGGGTIN